MYIIGISAHFHDSSACLFKDGRLIFACEEEKFSGVKHDNSFPVHVLDYIMNGYNIQPNEIEGVCYYENPKIKLDRVTANIKSQYIKHPMYSIRSYFNAKNMVSEIDKKLQSISENVFYSTHHESHMYYSYYTSKFKDSMCVSVDGVGESDTMAYGIPCKDEIEYHSFAQYPHSFGLYYSAMTSFLGFKPNEGEYKIMGLASYGNHKKYLDQVRKLIKYRRSGLTCNMDVFTWNRSNKVMFNVKLPELLGIDQRLPEEPITQDHKDLAASVQYVYEENLFKALRDIEMTHVSENLSLGGGCAYNGTANGKITEHTHYKHLWIPSAPSDAGSSIGACIHYLVKNGQLNGKITQNPFLGPRYDDIKYKIYNKEIIFYKCEVQSELVRLIASELNKGKVVGWFQGRIEFGARALGNRSILADPTVVGMKDKINRVIKKREGFRPFAPMVIKEKQRQFFDMVDDIPYMNQVVKVKAEYVNKLPAVTHIDGTARVQTVYDHTLIHDLLIEFEKLSGYPILLNTSFNIKDKTMVLTPQDALETFYNTEMDILSINNYVIFKKYDTSINKVGKR